MKKSLEEIRIARIVEEQFGVPFPDEKDKKEEEQPNVNALAELQNFISRLELYWQNWDTPNQFDLADKPNEHGVCVVIRELKSHQARMKKE